MNVTTPLTEQMLYFFVCGIFIGLLYEVLRLFRQVIKHNNFLTGTEDVLFFSFCGFLLFWLSMNIGNGQFRIYFLISAVAGAFVYYFTIGRLVNLAYKVILKWLLKIFRFLLSPIKKLIGIIVLKLKRIFVRLYKKIENLNKNTVIHLKNSSRMMYNKLYAKRGRSAQNDINVKIKAKVKR